MNSTNTFADLDVAISRMAITTTATTTTTTTKFDYTSDLIVLLDIDQTMICSKLFTSKAAAQAYVKEMPTTTGSDSDGGCKVQYFQLDSKDDPNLVFHVNCRPFLKEFLEKVCSMFETHIFTAGTLEYAKSVVSILDPHGMFLSLDRIWSRADCARAWVPATASQHHPTGYQIAYWKNLSSLPFDLSRVVLIDDDWSNFKVNPCNMIMVKAFYDDPNDKDLVFVLELLRETLKNCEDVRPILKLKYERHFYLLSKSSTRSETKSAIEAFLG
jgi:TFIIF-interacting CTD phosphatase-like protein